MTRRWAITRFCQIIKLVLIYFVFHNFNSHKNKRIGRKIRESCERLGTTFLKVGQILSVRYDLLEKEDCEELQKLLDRIPPFRYDLVRDIVKHDLGKYPEELFNDFEIKPLAAASIAQVHVAYLHSGEKIAVKIRRPFIGQRIETDINLLKLLSFMLQIAVPRLKYLGIRDVAKECEEIFINEIDFRHEASNIVTVKNYVEDILKTEKPRVGLGMINIPKIYNEFCSYNVLAMEFMEGIPVNKYKEVKDPEYDPVKSVNSLLSGSFRSLFLKRTYYFHGDPHPANMIMQKNGDLALLDYGVMGTFDPKLAGLTSDLVFYTYSKDIKSLIKTIAKLSGKKMEYIENKMKDDIENYIGKSTQADIGFWFSGLLHSFLKNKIKVPLDFALFGRTMILLDGVVKMLDPSKTAIDLIGPDLERIIKNRMKENLKPNFAPLLYNLSEKIKKTPELANKLIDKYYDNPLRIIKDIKSEITK